MNKLMVMMVGASLGGITGGAIYADPAAASSSTTNPSTQPMDADRSADKALVLKAWRALADPRPDVREEAKAWLFTLSPADLPVVLEIVRKNRPVSPSQGIALREVVTHLYLRGLGYTPSSNGFLGVRFDLDQDATEPESGGVEIRHRMPGFCAYRYLRDGDVIRAIVGPPNLQLHQYRSMSDVVRSFHAGQTITFEVLRDGAVRLVPVVLDAYPTDIGPAGSDEFLVKRQNDADTYWNENFERLVSIDVF